MKIRKTKNKKTIIKNKKSISKFKNGGFFIMKKSFKAGERVGKKIRNFIINKFFTKKFKHDYDEKPSFIMDIFKSINTNDTIFKKRIKNDKEFIMEEVKKNGFSLNFINEKLKNNFDIVSEAVKQNGFSILFASDELKKIKK